MDINILTLVTAALALIVGFATLVITFLTYRYYIRSDRKNVRRKLKQKEERLEGLNNLIWGSAFSAWGGLVTDKHFQQRDQLEKEIEDLRDRL